MHTEILVICGYSFPGFNKDIDDIIINSMQKLKRVYFQNPNPESIQERFMDLCRYLSNDELSRIPYLVNDVSSFTVPY